jgi:hypothetical protein
MEDTTKKTVVFVDGFTSRTELGLWHVRANQYAQHLGNENQPESEHSIYVRYAAILKV